MKKENYYYASLFSSAGVGCYGFHQQGFECILTSELLDKRIKFQKINSIGKFEEAYLTGDIKKYDLPKIINNNLQIVKSKKLDVLIATPPCQGISLANHKKNEKDLERNSLVVESIKCIDLVEPRIFILENVQNFLKSACIDIDKKTKSIEHAIDFNLGEKYNIYKRVVNFKFFGSPSSRTRCIVIGVLKTENFSPLSVFPSRVDEKKLIDVIGKYPSLKKMGEIHEKDIYHNFKKYDEKMRLWIANIKQGGSAFDNKKDEWKPHQIKNGKIVINQNKNGDKYKRQVMNSVPPCIHTRNDIMASQNTVHPIDDRVFSIREVMEMMSVPKDFSWSEKSEKELNKMPLEKKIKFLRENEMNIRSCLGEAVPTAVFSSIAKNIRESFNIPTIRLNDFKNKKLKINKEHTINEIFAISEINNTNREQNSAFYTPEKTVFELLNKLDLPKSKTIKILEPSVGVGNFIPYIFKAFSSYDLVELDLLDIDSTSLSSVKKIIGMIGVPNNFKINYINKDFFDYESNEKYDLIIGNPPYGTVSTDSSNNYRIEQSYSKINNLFILFMEKSLKISKQLSFIIPKSFLSAPQYEKTRHIMEKMNISCIVDFGEKGFEGVKIETVGISLKNSKIRKDNKVYIKSIPLGLSLLQKQQYICDKNLPYWVIYRNEQFDNVLNKMKLGVFTSFRDRQILKKHINNENKGVPLLKARNIGDRKIEKTLNNAYIENIENFTISKKMNEKLVMIPNLSYSPRACWLPEECAVDGSVALLEPIDDEVIEDRDLAYYSSEEFNSFYRIARNYSTRSLNIDRLSVQFFGVFR